MHTTVRCFLEDLFLVKTSVEQQSELGVEEEEEEPRYINPV